MSAHTPAAQAATLDLEVLQQFRIIFRSVRKHFQVVENRVGLRGSLLWALSIVAERPGISLTRLAGAMSVHQSTASNLLARLVDLELVRKERNSRDNRVAGLYVTETGQSRLAQAPGPLRGLLPDALQKLPADTLAELHGDLQRLLDQMETLEMKGEGIPLADL